MASKRKSVRVVPSARRLINSLRDLGYQPVEAVADLVDNSIAAHARNVDITVHWDGGDSWIRIADDGRGMPGGRITEAMRYGSEREYDDDDLGKFGLGLKTASMSQCRRLTVASRQGAGGRIEVRQLDLDYIEARNDWEVLILGAAERPDEAIEPLRKRGTVVLWEGLDRILTYKDPSSGWARNHLIGLAEALDQHLGMVFHRFLQGEARRAKLKISINGTTIRPWDPFARSEAVTMQLPAKTYEVNTPHGSGLVEVAPFILPPKASFSSPAEHKRLAGPYGWNRQQGLYIYRSDRLIQAGSWSRMRTIDEHTKLARVGVSFAPSLDDAFGINVAKMRVSLPPELREQLESDIGQVARRARKVYDTKPDTTGGGGARRGSAPGSGDTPSGRNGAAAGGAGAKPGGARNGAARDEDDREAASQRRRDALVTAARYAGEEQALERIVVALTRSDREVARDLGW
jgi:hypothetical protein